MTRQIRRVARRLHQFLLGPGPDARTKPAFEREIAGDWIQVYYRPGGVGPRRVLSLPAGAVGQPTRPDAAGVYRLPTLEA